MLTPVVVAHNEEEQLDACLSFLEFCDSMVAVPDWCIDGSEEIARQNTEQVVTGALEGPEGPRRHAGIDLARRGFLQGAQLEGTFPALQMCVLRVSISIDSRELVLDREGGIADEPAS